MRLRSCAEKVVVICVVVVGVFIIVLFVAFVYFSVADYYYCISLTLGVVVGSSFCRFYFILKVSVIYTV